MATSLNFHSWWGRQSIEPQRTDLWQLGPLHLWIQYLSNRWSIHWTHTGDWLDPSVRIVPGTGGELPPARAHQINCVLGTGPRADLLFVPALADRPLINRLPTTLNLLPGEATHLFVISPLKLRIESAESGKLLHEIPTHRLSDTWFGPVSASTAANSSHATPLGELCYASAAPAFLDLRDVPIRLHCAISSVFLRNAGKETLRIDRINVPLPRLSLFYSPRTGFWTDSFSLTCEDNGELASLKIDKQPPNEASPTQFVSAPHQAVTEAPPIIRAVGALFRERERSL